MVLRKIHLLEERQNKTVEDIKNIKDQITSLHKIITDRNIANFTHKSQIIEVLDVIEKKLISLQMEKSTQTEYSGDN